jgi:putative transcriptional regulator
MKSRLRELRAKLDWTQDDLAEKAGVTRQTIIAIEAGKYNPSLTLAFKLSKLFKTNIESIFEYDEKTDGK